LIAGAQQAPGFWAQKSWNCCAFEPLGGVLLAVPLLGAVVPPPGLVLPVVVPVLPVGVLVAVGVAVALDDVDELDVLVPVLELLLLAAAAAAGGVLDTGTETSTGGPGTCSAVASLPPQPVTARASRPVATSAMMRPGMWLTPL
jgi:hypothetical protein